MPEETGARPARRIGRTVLVFLLLLGGFALFGRLARRETGPPLVAMPQASGGDARPPAVAPSAPERPAPEAEPEVVDALSLEEFMGILESRAPPDVVRKAAAEFSAHPAIVRAWKRYTRRRGKKDDARELLDVMTRIPQFQQAVAKLSADPRVAAVFAALLEDARVDATVRADLAGGEDTTDAAVIAREWERMAKSGVRVADSTAMTGSGRAAGFAQDLGRKGALGSGGRSGSGAREGAGAGPNAHDVNAKMEQGFKTKSVGDSDTIEGQKYLDAERKWITRFLAALKPDSARVAIQARLESGSDDLWGACFSTGNFELCRDVCGRVPEARCEDKTPYQACRGSGARSPEDCVRGCLSGVPMACEGFIDMAEWRSLCKSGNSTPPLAQGECLSTMDWGPQVCQGSPMACWQPSGGRGGTARSGPTTGGGTSGGSSTGGGSGSGSSGRTSGGSGTTGTTGTTGRTTGSSSTAGTASGGGTTASGGRSSCYTCSVACMTPSACPTCGRSHGACQNDFASSTFLTGSRQCSGTSPHAKCTGTVRCSGGGHLCGGR